jgi:hypothetical protein
MQFEINQDYPNQYIEALMTHRGETLHWIVEAYRRTTPHNTATVFDNLNRWLATFPLETQTALFTEFRYIREAFDTYSDLTKLQTQLSARLTTVYQYLSFDSLKNWMSLNSQIFMPAELKVAYQNNETQLTINLTYLRKDYYDLVILSILLKPLLPIFGQYIDHTKKEVAVWLKEHYAFGLIQGCSFTQCPAYARLVTYVNTLTENELRKKNQDNQRRSAIFGGLGTEELPVWLLSKALVRRVVIYEENAPVSLISNIYQNIEQLLNGLDKTFNERISEKIFFNDENAEDNTSIIENYKIKQEVSDGDLEVLSHYMRDLTPIFNQIDSTIDPKKQQYCVEFFEANPLIAIGPCHMTLAQWVLARAISPRSLPFLDKRALHNAMIVTQSLLWHWGFNELALIIGAEPYEETSYVMSTVATRLNKQHYTRLVEAYPYYRQLSKSNTSLRKMNVACRAIDSLSDSLMKHDWLVYGPNALLDIEGYRSTKQRHIISAEIRNKLGDLLTKLLSLEHQAVQ